MSELGEKFAMRILPHLNCVATLPCEMSTVSKATTENKTIFSDYYKLFITNFFFDAESEMILNNGQYLAKLRRTKKCNF